MRNFKMILQYEGTRYKGWQRQESTEHTIQGKLEGILSKMAGTPVEIQGSGRTDAGVHALGQVANFHADIRMSEQELCAEANKWELSHGGISGRTAQQFINYLAGLQQ